MTEAEKALPNPTGAFTGSSRGGTRNEVPYRELVTIPPGAYPDFDALQAEELWLYDTIRNLPHRTLLGSLRGESLRR